jgi:hypothetical protein
LGIYPFDGEWLSIVCQLCRQQHFGRKHVNMSSRDVIVVCYCPLGSEYLSPCPGRDCAWLWHSLFTSLSKLAETLPVAQKARPASYSMVTYPSSLSNDPRLWSDHQLPRRLDTLQIQVIALYPTSQSTSHSDSLPPTGKQPQRQRLLILLLVQRPPRDLLEPGLFALRAHTGRDRPFGARVVFRVVVLRVLVV